METPGEGPAFDKEVDLEARQEHLVERSDDQFILTDSQNAHINSRQEPILQTPSIRLVDGGIMRGVKGMPAALALVGLTAAGGVAQQRQPFRAGVDLVNFGGRSSTGRVNQ